jgi:L-aminopeptidase/D-esterase-like protein
MDRSLGTGFAVGHWTDREARTGCTVILVPRGNVASCEIRGSSPSSRELILLDPDRRLTEIHAVVFTGGSAFGLASVDGVVSYLSDNGIGYETGIRPVPIVPAAVVFDLGVGTADAFPGPDEGRAACEAAVSSAIETGRVGAGTGATVGKWAGREHAVAGGLGIGVAREDDSEVRALAVVNAVGDVIGEDGSILAGTTAPEPRMYPPLPPQAEMATNTVLCFLATRASLDKRDVRWLASRGADGVTTAVRPAHTRYDGDVTIAMAAPPDDATASAQIDLLGVLATRAVAAAVRDAVSD